MLVGRCLEFYEGSHGARIAAKEVVIFPSMCHRFFRRRIQQNGESFASQQLHTGNFGLYVHRNRSGLLGTGRLGGVNNYISNTYSLHCHHQNDSASRWAVVWAILMFSLIVWAKSQDSVHKRQFLKRRERRAEADRTEVLLLTSQAPYH